MDALVCTLDDTASSATFVAALVARSGVAVVLAGPQPAALARLARACARRGLAVELDGETIIVAGRSLAIVSEPARETVRVREHRVELARNGSAQLGERVELLAAAPLLEAIERGSGLRWALSSSIHGSDGFSTRVDLGEQKPDSSLDAGLQRCFPGLVGRVGFCSAVGPLPGAALHLSVLLGTGTTVDGVRDLLAAQADARSRWPKLRLRRGFGSADCLGDPGVHLDLDAITSVGPLLRLVAYYDPPTVLADDLLRRRGGSSTP